MSNRLEIHIKKTRANNYYLLSYYRRFDYFSGYFIELFHTSWAEEVNYWKGAFGNFQKRLSTPKANTFILLTFHSLITVSKQFILAVVQIILHSGLYIMSWNSKNRTLKSASRFESMKPVFSLPSELKYFT